MQNQNQDSFLCGRERRTLAGEDQQVDSWIRALQLSRREFQGDSQKLLKPQFACRQMGAGGKSFSSEDHKAVIRDSKDVFETMLWAA